jgi:hypothetical protein
VKKIIVSRRFKRIILVSGLVAVISAIIILFISPATKYLVEKYGAKYTGRKIEMSWAYVNPFTGYVYFRNLKLYESDGDSVFFFTHGLGVNISLFKLISGTYEVSELTLTGPKCTIVQNGKKFNFDDLLSRLTPEKKDSTKAPVHFNILNARINDGVFYYREESIPVNYFVKQVNFESSGFRWDVDTVPGIFSLVSGPGSGSVKCNYTINVKNMDYHFSAIVDNLDLKIIEQYLKDLSAYGNFSATMDGKITAKGNLKHKDDITSKGNIAISDFHFGKNPKEDYASFRKLVLVIRELSPKNKIYSFDSVSLSHPYFKYERYDQLDNLQNMFGKKGSNIKAAKADPEKFNLIIEIAEYIKVLAKNFFRSDYKINRISIDNADMRFNDYSLTEEFSIALNPLNILADSISKSRDKVNISFKSAIKPYGNLWVNVSVNPKDSSDFDMHYHLEKLPSALFNPYIISQTSFPLDRGSLEFKGDWTVRNGIIRSANHLLIIDPRTTNRVKNRDAKWIPMPLIMSFVRERGNVIDYQIPVKGNLKDPKFKLGDVFSDLVRNIFIKPPSTPYLFQVANLETEIEKSIQLKWNMRESKVGDSQKKFITRMASFLRENKDAIIDVYPKEYSVKEKEHILFFEAKKKYFLSVNHPRTFTENDSIKIDKMSAKDSAFVQFLDKQVRDSLLFTIQEKCLRFIGENRVNEKLRELNEERKKNFMFYFNDEGVANRVKFHPKENVIPFNGFSFYGISYKGSLPESLLKAYREMNQLDQKPPRKEYKNERKKNKAELKGIARSESGTH